MIVSFNFLQKLSEDFVILWKRFRRDWGLSEIKLDFFNDQPEHMRSNG